MLNIIILKSKETIFILISNKQPNPHNLFCKSGQCIGKKKSNLGALPNFDPAFWHEHKEILIKIDHTSLFLKYILNCTKKKKN